MEVKCSIYIYICFYVQGELEEGLTKFQALVSENPRDFRPYLCQVYVITILLVDAISYDSREFLDTNKLCC